MCKISKLYKLVLVIYIFAVNLLICNLVKADNINYTRDIKVSLLTCSSGDELYTAYGHSAIRIVDNDYGIDVVFNYGTFDFGTPYFYLKFLNGTLDYMLSSSDFPRFIHTYQREQRGVIEDELILSSETKLEIEHLLIENLRPENRFYRYDFFFDNCATRIRDIVFKACKLDASPYKIEKEDKTFRSCLHEKVGPNEWSGFGIDLILGIRADKNVSVYDMAMLPDYLQDLISSAHLTGNSYVLLDKPKVDGGHEDTISPFLSALIFFLLCVGLCAFELRTNRWLKALDVFVAIAISLVSILFWYLWIVSEIRITSYNLNVLWASLLYIPLVIAIARRKRKLAKYLIYCNISLIAIYIVIVLLGVQYASAPILLIVFALLTRNFVMLKKLCA